MVIYFEPDDDLPDLPPEELVRQRKDLSIDILYRLAERLKFDRLCILSQLDEAEGCMDETTKAWRRRARFAYDIKDLATKPIFGKAGLDRQVKTVISMAIEK